MAYSHRTVLLEPAIDALLSPAFGRRSAVPEQAPPLDGVYVDGTFGRGGHSRLLLSRLAPGARLLVFDKDPAAIAEALALRADDARVEIVHEGFADLAAQLDRLGIDRVDGVLLDLGVSSPQIDEAERGFSFMRDGPLDMRMDTSRGQTAAQWLAEADQEQIKEVIADYGEERFAFQIAKAIVARRQSRPLRTTGELAELVAGAVRTREKGQHPATRTFQAVRIHINEELAQLAHALPAALTRLRAGGRLAVISFHSLEDRMVKQCFAAAAHPGRDRARLPIPERDMPQPYVTLLGRVQADAAEVADNVRARSAVLRVAERTAVPLSLDEASAFVRLPGRPVSQRRAGRAAR
ncbi:16S rRNA (cytosine(1402)-N(4))-methyltransferase RsmH [Castellaniella denitrificans]|uniref:Ribosomal RNA small subunit methyltransferase H n=1 Tax=Castellaniella denitrificans TaxID=56119 RepID=A0ABT4M373_9BURK|nr:16S rRNA (cytosine(1402)-N(4))-methyltransferase RsmH [Castellaniella denitrificans]MCZ4329480.1 16S rRNA (cytosine(1402)-N(4))-methyltransferase RsmH [Castellaniella denitrificans]